MHPTRVQHARWASNTLWPPTADQISAHVCLAACPKQCSDKKPSTTCALMLHSPQCRSRALDGRRWAMRDDLPESGAPPTRTITTLSEARVTEAWCCATDPPVHRRAGPCGQREKRTFGPLPTCGGGSKNKSRCHRRTGDLVRSIAAVLPTPLLTPPPRRLFRPPGSPRSPSRPPRGLRPSRQCIAGGSAGPTLPS